MKDFTLTDYEKKQYKQAKQQLHKYLRHVVSISEHELRGKLVGVGDEKLDPWAFHKVLDEMSQSGEIRRKPITEVIDWKIETINVNEVMKDETDS